MHSSLTAPRALPGLPARTDGMAARLSRPAATTLLLAAWWLVQMWPQLFKGGNAPGPSALTAVQEGSLTNTLLVVSIGALGCWQLPRVWPALRARTVRVLLTFLVLYLVWALLSITWSVEQGLTLRRWVKLAILLCGCVGLGLGFYGAMRDGERTFARHIVFAGAIAVCALWLPQLASGNLDVLSPTYALKDEGAGTAISFPIAYSFLAALYLRRQGVLGARVTYAYLGICLISLFAQKVRLIFAASCLLIVLDYALGHTRAQLMRAVAVLAGGIIAVSAVGFLLNGNFASDVADTAWRYATLEARDSTTMSLDGRSPLWDALVPYANERLWTGYGFGAFWNPAMLDYIWAVVKWPAPSAHNGFLDEVLGTGVIGLALFLSVWLTGLVLAVRAWWSGRNLFGLLVFGWLVFFLLLNAGDTIMQFYFSLPFYVSVTALCALLAQGAGAVASRGRQTARDSWFVAAGPQRAPRTVPQIPRALPQPLSRP